MSTQPMTFDEFKRLIAIEVKHNAFTGKVECDVTFTARARTAIPYAMYEVNGKEESKEFLVDKAARRLWDFIQAQLTYTDAHIREAYYQGLRDSCDKWPHPCDDRKIAEIVKSVQDTRTWDGTVTVRK